MPNFRKLQADSKNVSLKIGSKGPKKLGPFLSLFLMRKTFCSGQKWFLSPYFPLIRGMFLMRSSLRLSFWALEVPETRVRKRPYGCFFSIGQVFSAYVELMYLKPFECMLFRDKEITIDKGSIA